MRQNTRRKGIAITALSAFFAFGTNSPKIRASNLQYTAIRATNPQYRTEAKSEESGRARFSELHIFNEILQWIGIGGCLQGQINELGERVDNLEEEVYATPTSTPTFIPEATPIPTATPTLIPSPTPTAIPTLTPSPTATPTLRPSPSPSPTPYITPSPSPTPYVTPTATPTLSPSPTPYITPSPSPTATPTATPSPLPTATPTPNPLEQLIEFACLNLPRLQDQPPKPDVQDVNEGFYIELFKVWQNSDGTFRSERVADLRQDLDGNLNNPENYRISPGTRDHYLVAIAGSSLVNVAGMYDTNIPRLWTNPESCRHMLILPPDTTLTNGSLMDIYEEGSNSEGSNIIYDERVRAL